MKNLFYGNFSQESIDSFYQSPPANGVLHVNEYPESIWVSFNPLTPNLFSNSPFCLLNDSHYVSFKNLVIGSISNPIIDIFLYSHHLSA